MQIFDTHCHYNMEPLYDDRQEFFTQGQKAGVVKALVASADLHTSEKSLAICAQNPALVCSLGIHPHGNEEKIHTATQFEHQVKQSTKELDTLYQLVKDNKDKSYLRAIGETGLDFYRLDKLADDFAWRKELQILLLTRQIAMAKEFSLPLILHVRDEEVFLDSHHNAYGLILQILRENDLISHPMIFHCFSGDPAYLHEVLKFKNSMISFAGNITYQNVSNLQELVSLTPPERLLVETDAPFLSPQSQRGNFCQPAFITETVAFMEEKFGINPELLYNNAISFFS